MAATLKIESTLRHDGDGVAYFTVSGANEAFSACVGTCAHAEEHLRLAAALKGFSGKINEAISYKFGGTGTCQLDISCLDTLGHVGVWMTFTEDWPIAGSKRPQTGSLFMRSDLAALDTFVSELMGFSTGPANVACLRG